MTKLKIKVTKEILERSKMCGEKDYGISYSRGCAIALAVSDIFPRCSVGSERISVFSSLEITCIDLPKEAALFICMFDGTSRDKRPLMDEFEFEISIPDTIIEKINIEEIKPLLQNHPTLQLIENY